METNLTSIYRVAEMRAIEADNDHLPLMERAGRAGAEVARSLAGDRGGRVVVLAGPGNNGGDAFVVARWLRTWYFDLAVVFIGDASKLPPPAAAAHAAFLEAGGSTVTVPDTRRPALIVDGLFGVGLTRSLSDGYAALVHWANASGAPILALDIPSGLNADTGIATGPTIDAVATATFICLKPGLLTGDGPDHCGEVSVHSLDVAAAPAALGHRLDWPVLAAALPVVLGRRMRNVNKGTFGTLGILGGTEGMGGALILAGRAALRTGAGKVWLGFLMADPPKLDTSMPELMLRHAGPVLDARPDALVVGPGLGTSDAARSLLQRALALPVPVALDADALNLIARDPALLATTKSRGAPTLATPHPGEAARVLGTDIENVQNDRMKAAHELAQRLSANVVLKGVGSVLRIPTAHGTSMPAAVPHLPQPEAATFCPACWAPYWHRAWTQRRHCAMPFACMAPRRMRWLRKAPGRSDSRHRSCPMQRAACSTRRGERADQGSNTVAPVVPRDSSARCAAAASFSGKRCRASDLIFPESTSLNRSSDIARSAGRVAA